ncbi:MAG: hypothetical protein Q9P44_03975 [Anaerolineae bacterium]|nr:hypothetical protein [Anaerolineae bacterium]
MDILKEYHVPLLIQAGLAIIWSGIFMSITVGLFGQKRWALRYRYWSILAFIVYNLLRAILLTQADYDRNRLTFLALITLIISAIPLLALLHQKQQEI